MPSDLPPSERSTVAPTPAATQAATLSASLIRQTTAPLRALADQFGEQFGGVAVAAAAGVVLGVGEDDRAVGPLRQALRLGDGLGGGQGVLDEAAFLRVDEGQQGVGGGIGFGLGVGEGGDGRAAAGEIGVGEAEAERQFGGAQAFGEAGAFGHDGLHGRHQRALAAERDPEIQGAEGAGPGAGAVDALQQQAHGLGAGGFHVDVGVGAERHDGVGQFAPSAGSGWRAGRG